MRLNRHPGLICTVALVALGALFATPAAAQLRPLLVNYGKVALSQEGDNDHAQVIYLSVPAATKGPLYLRVFDPETAGAFDLVYGQANSTTTFTVFGGSGAYAAASAQSRQVSPAELDSGRMIAQRAFQAAADTDGRWETIAALDASQGDRVGDRAIFRLVVQGTGGDDGNAYDVFLSARADSNAAPDAVSIFSFSPTVRIPDSRTMVELRFHTPDDADSLVVGDFDAARGQLYFTTKFASSRLAASDQDAWRTDRVRLSDEQRGAPAAITLRGGLEIPNDITLYVTDAKGSLIPIELPPRATPPNSRPVAVATIGPATRCTAVTFDASKSSDPDGDALGYRWLFGDGATAAGQTVEHDYGRDGRFTVRLEATDSSGLVGNGTALEVQAIAKNPPVPRTVVRSIVATGEPIQFDGSGSTAGDWSIKRQVWTFPDKTKQRGPHATYSFTQPGEYVVVHEVQDDSDHRCDSAKEEVRLRVNAPPVASAGDDRRLSVAEESTFDGSQSADSDGRLTQYRWDFGDGSGAEGAVVRHAFAKPGSYKVSLTVADDSNVANSKTVDELTAIVNDPPVAMAGPDVAGAIDEPLKFDGSQSRDADGKILSYAWDFGDGTRGEGAKVEHAYAKSGVYRVRLSVTDDSTTGSAVTTDETVIRINEPPVARAGDDQLVTASAVSFDGSASTDPDGKIVSYDWSFGDGSTGSGPTPTHVYAKPGTYQVGLVVADDSGTIRNTASASMRVVVNAVPIADAGPDLVGAPGEKLTFQGSRSVDPDGKIAEYLWDFRDGTTASGKVVTHAFDKPGIYPVRLRVKDDTGNDKAVDFAESRVVVNAPPVADAGADILAAPGDSVHLSAAQSWDPDGKIADYRWDISDAAEPVFGAELSRTFDAPGIYTAQLTVSDDSGAANSTAKSEIRIAINHAPVADAGPNIESSDATILFDAGRSVDADNDPLTYAWDFGDGQAATGSKVRHTYAAGGTYPVVLSVDDGTGLENATSRAAISAKINQPPVAHAGASKHVCVGDIVLFDGTRSQDPEGGPLSYAWDFGDGTTSDIVNPTKVYTKNGTYPITLTVRDDSNFSNNTGTDRISARVDQGPLAVAGDDIHACTNTVVTFDGSKSFDIDGSVNSFAWDFGDGMSGAGERTTHIYTRPGTYRTILTIQGDQVGQCDTTSSDEAVVKIDEGPVAIIKAPPAAPVSDVIGFDGSSSRFKEGKITAWEWDFGDGQRGAGPAVEHKYAAAGTYRVTLTLHSDSDSPSCQVVSARHVVTVNASPIADAGADRTVATNQVVDFDASGSRDPDGGIIAYEWDFGDGEKATGVEARHRYAKPGLYKAVLLVRDDSDLPNATASDQAAVSVNTPPQPVITGPAVACVGDDVTWGGEKSTDADGRIDGTTWRFGDGESGSGATAHHRYAKPGRYEVLLTVDDGSGVANGVQQATQLLHVNEPPRAVAGPDRLVCPGQPVSFDGGASSDADGKIARYIWDFGDGSSMEGAQVEHSFAAPGDYTTRLTVVDDSGSRCAATTTMAHVVVNAPPTAVIDVPSAAWSGGANDAVLLDASRSHDPDGQALTFAWKVGDGAVLSGERVRHAFAESGDIPLELTVSDSSGLACGSASASARLTVQSRK